MLIRGSGCNKFYKGLVKQVKSYWTDFRVDGSASSIHKQVWWLTTQSKLFPFSVPRDLAHSQRFPLPWTLGFFRQCKYANSLIPIGKINRFLCPEGRKSGHSQTGTPFLNGADKWEGAVAISQTERYGSIHLHPEQRSLGCIKRGSISRNCPPGGKAALAVGPLAARLWPLKSLAALFAPEFPAQPSTVFIIPLVKAPQDVFLFLETAAPI